MNRLQSLAVRILRWSERYTKTDMVYLAGGSFWLAFEQFFSIVLAFGLATAFGHFAAPDMYGNYKYVLSLSALIGAVSLSRLGDAVGQSAAQGKEGVLRQGFWLNLKWSWALVTVSLAGAAYYAFAQHNPFVAASLVVIALVQPVLTSSMLFQTFLFGKRDFKRGSLYLLCVNTLTTSAVIAALFVGERAILLVATYFIARTVGALCMTYLARRRAQNTETDPTLLNYGSHLSIMGAIGVVADAFDSLIVFTLLGPTNLAVYAFAIAMPEQIKGVVKNLNNIVFPKFAELPLSVIKQTVGRKIVLLTTSLACVLFVYILAAPTIFAWLFPLYIAAVPYSQWYAATIVFAGASQILYSALYSHKKTRELYYISNFPPLFLIIALATLVPLYGIIGAIAAQAIFRASHCALTVFLFARARD